MTNDNNYDNSSNNIQKFFSDNVIGSVHMSQYRDPNDDSFSYNSGDTQDPDLNQGLTNHQFVRKETHVQNHNEKKSDLALDDDTLNPSMNNIRIILDQTKRTQTHTDKNDILITKDPFKSFVTANENPISLNKRILISQKRDTPIIPKKFQPHPPIQLPRAATLRSEETNYSLDISNIPTDDQNKSKSAENTNKPDTTPTLPTDQQIIERETVNNTNPLLTEENLNATIDANNEPNIQDLALNIDPQDKTLTSRNLIITPTNNNTHKRIINPYTKNLHTPSDPHKNNQNITTAVTETTTPFTGFLQTIDTDYHTPISLLPKTITFNRSENNPTPSLNIPDNNTFNSQIQHNHKIINTNNKLSNPFLLNTKQAPNVSVRHINLPQELEPLRTVILSQHTALENHIKELGSTCLNFTSVIEQKKECANKLHTDNPQESQNKMRIIHSPLI